MANKSLLELDSVLWKWWKNWDWFTVIFTTSEIICSNTNICKQKSNIDHILANLTIFSFIDHVDKSCDVPECKHRPFLTAVLWSQGKHFLELQPGIKMALRKVKGSLERVLDKNMQDLVRGIRNNKEKEVRTFFLWLFLSRLCTYYVHLEVN